mgnify:FL=1
MNKQNKITKEAKEIIEFMKNSQKLTLEHNTNNLSKEKIEEISNNTAMGAIQIYWDEGLDFLKHLKKMYIAKQTKDCKKMGWKFITPDFSYQYEEVIGANITTYSF